MNITLADSSWAWGTASRTAAERLGRSCLRFDGDGASLETAAGLDLLDGAIEAEIAVGSERSFHGVFWRGQDADNFESFFVRPHQVGNDDSVQYTPVWNGSSAWQLYHGTGFWAPVAFPIGEWFTIRVVFGGGTAEIFVGNRSEPVLVTHQRRDPAPGRVGVLVAGTGLHVARFSVEPEARPTRTAPPPVEVTGIVPAWAISEPFPEGSTPDPDALGWTELSSEPSGLVNLARAHPVVAGRNTVYARTSVHAEQAADRELALGFSDRVVVSLNGRVLYRGDCTYRSRDYRFLGSIGYWDTVVLPLQAGENDLLVAVSEDFGGWGVQARFADLDGVALRPRHPA